ncbi:polygalacturonase QRT2 isoform X1 [Beta vulgaris subsp. vulgaris]|uniref:polygalacturonase QRT2 isoform X1 n=1 Tax=Beta vulgaris subsp. vulgaris TaxID=3555 RepID=UPI00203678F9|nr:polygalacturonase QRT2 isoform X1 [Beta vulgaris subsp. vulgaris]
MTHPMSLKFHFLILGLTILFSSFSHVCLSSYPLPEHNSKNYITNSSSTNNIIQDDYDVSYDDDDFDSQYLVNYDTVILDRIKHSHRARSRDHAHAPASSPSRIVNVDHYIKSGRRRDHTKAFKKAWKEACYTNARVLLVPRHKKYRLRPIKFSGPCHSPLIIKIKGTIEASTNIANYKNRQQWLVFENLRNFKVEGGGTIDGRGHIWWQNSCKVNKTKPCQHAPTAVTFIGCKNFIVDGLKITNAQQMHLTFQKCAAVRASNIFIRAPGNSPNTDGIHVTETRNIQITRSLIRTGDDCVSIVSGSKDVQVSEITCGPGHGISIGSLGKGHSKAHVSNVLVNKARLSGTQNGVRIKTWQGGQGYAKNVVFQNIVMHNVSNPIIIDQHYCDQKTPCPEMKSAVHVQDVVYKNIKGTSFTEAAIKLDCSKNHKCRGIVLQNIDLVTIKGKKAAKAECKNVELFHRGKVSPGCSHET